MQWALCVHAMFHKSLSRLRWSTVGELSSGKETLVASLAGLWECKSNGVVWCVNRPHTRSLLTLPTHFNWACKVLNGWYQSRSDSRKLHAVKGLLDRGIGTGGQEAVLCANVVPVWAVWIVAKGIITAYLITPGWKRCQSICQLFYTNDYLW